MRPDLAAAMRLLSALPVHTHERKRPAERGENMREEHWNSGRKQLIRPTRSENGGRNRRAIIANGKRYDSVRDAVYRQADAVLRVVKDALLSERAAKAADRAYCEMDSPFDALDDWRAGLAAAWDSVAGSDTDA